MRTAARYPAWPASWPSHGVPTVLAMAEEVSDRYAIHLASHLHRALARAPGTVDPLTALSDARREAERALG